MLLLQNVPLLRSLIHLILPSGFYKHLAPTELRPRAHSWIELALYFVFKAHLCSEAHRSVVEASQRVQSNPFDGSHRVLLRCRHESIRRRAGGRASAGLIEIFLCRRKRVFDYRNLSGRGLIDGVRVPPRHPTDSSSVQSLLGIQL